MNEFKSYFLDVLKNDYFNFSGRVRRRVYWMFTLYLLIILLCALVLDNILGGTIGNLPYGALYFIVGLLTTIPQLGLVVRRLHDVNKSGWMFLIILIPLIGSIWLIVLLCSEGTRGENKYGADPKAGERRV